MTLDTAQYGPPAREAQIEAMLDEAQFVFSGMVYGYTFTYVPSDKTRQVDEVFVLTPIAEISRGNPQLKVRQTYIRAGKVYAIIDYHLEEYEQHRISAWETNTAPRLSGTGDGVYFTGPEEKITAHKNAAKSALRAYLRDLTYNKPKEVTGTFIFTEAPRVFPSGGRYVSSASIKLELENVKPYSRF